MKQFITEAQRLQKLAGISEIKIIPSVQRRPEFINPNSPNAIILTDVYYIGDNAQGDLSSYQGSAVPSYELPGYTLDQIKIEGDGMLYIKKDEKGWYDEKEGAFESKDENSTTRIKKEYIKLI